MIREKNRALRLFYTRFRDEVDDALYIDIYENVGSGFENVDLGNDRFEIVNETSVGPEIAKLSAPFRRRSRARNYHRDQSRCDRAQWTFFPLARIEIRSRGSINFFPGDAGISGRESHSCS